MTRDEIIAMAREAGNGETRDLTEWLEEFAALVAAREREACAKIVDANAAACANNSMLQDVLRGSAAAIRARSKP